MPSKAGATQHSSSKPQHTTGQLVQEAPTASSLFHFSSRAELQPRSSSPDLHRGVIFRHRRQEAGAKKSLDPAAGKQTLARQERAGGWIRGALPACSHRGSFLCHHQLPRNGCPRGRRSLARLCTQGRRRGPVSSRGQDRRGQRWRWEERSFQEHPVRPQPGAMSLAEATPVTGFCPHPLLVGAAGGGGCGGRQLGKGLRCCGMWGRVLQGED